MLGTCLDLGVPGGRVIESQVGVRHAQGEHVGLQGDEGKVLVVNLGYLLRTSAAHRAWSTKKEYGICNWERKKGGGERGGGCQIGIDAAPRCGSIRSGILAARSQGPMIHVLYCCDISSEQKKGMLASQ